MADREGFEPSVTLLLHTLSNRVYSSAQLCKASQLPFANVDLPMFAKLCKNAENHAERKKGFKRGSNLIAFAPLQSYVFPVLKLVTMSAPPTEFRTRKGHRVYRRSRKLDAKLVFADNYTLRVKQDGGTSYFNLGTDKRDAGGMADEIMAFLAVEGNTVAEALIRYSEKHKNKALRTAKAPEPVKEVLTVGMMIERFLAVTSHLSPMTRRNNSQALRHIAAGIMGLPKLGVDQTKAQRIKWRAKVEPFPMSGFTTQQVEMFRQRELQKCEGDFKKIGSTSTTLNSYLRAARGVFAKKLRTHYDDLNLPDPLPFLGIAPLAEPSHRYQSSIDVPALIKEAKTTIYLTDKDAWIAFLLSFGVGLRREEIDKLMVEQIKIDDRRISIYTTEFFRPKAKNSDAYVDLTETITNFLKEYLESIPERRFVLPGKEVRGKLRCQKVFRSLMKWLREQGVTDQKPIHTLRKEAGSLIFKEGGSIDRVAEFLRNDPRVARDHYVGRKERIELELPGL